MNRRTVFDVLDATASTHTDKAALYQPTGGRDRIYSWLEFRAAAMEIACGLRALGLRKGDIVALDSETRAEFYLADLGVMTSGMIAAALYASLPVAELVKALANTDAKAVFVESPRRMRALLDAGAQSEFGPWILLTGGAQGAISLDELRLRGREAMAQDAALFERIRAEVQPEDYAVLYLTSGATGEPKMGLATHWALVSNIDMGPHVLPLGPEDTTLAFLPSAHIAQRIVIELLPMRCGTPVHFSQGLTRMAQEMRAIKPTFLLAPPRVWERIFATISTEIKKRPAIAQKLFYTAIGLGHHVAARRRDGRPIPGWMLKALKIADRAVFRKVRERFGGKLRVAASGAAPLGRELALFYESIGMPLIEGYGLTEGGVATLNPIDGPKPGSIGKLLPGVEARLSEEGELLLRSPALFSGYYKDPASTASVLRDGWLYTGDIGEIDDAGFLYITGRKKELIVSSNGKKIYPSRIELLFKTEPLISQAVPIGDKQPFITALFSINPAAALALDGMAAWKGKDYAEVAAAPPVKDAIAAAVKRSNQQLAAFEQIKRFRILDRDLSLELGELTPTMKVRRKQVIENFQPVIREMYFGREEPD